MNKKVLFFVLLSAITFGCFAQTSPQFSIKVPRLYVSVKRVITLNTPFACTTSNCTFISKLSYETANSSAFHFEKSYNDYASLNLMNPGDSIVFNDTLDVIDYNMTINRVYAKFDITTISSGRNGSVSTVSEQLAQSVYYDNMPYVETAKSNSNYSYKLSIQGIPNTDLSRTLPSHDSIRVVATPRQQITYNYSLPINDPFEYKWYYSTDNANNWTYIPSSDTSSLILSGEKLFGINYNQYINKTVLIKSLIFYNSTLLATSNVEPFTHRLSSPRIVNTTPYHVVCWGDTTGYFKVTFNRGLLAGEKLNFLLKDTINLIDYNVLNVSSLAADNSLTWPVELLGGTDYQLGLIGKYVFNNANEATYTSSPSHFANFHLNQPELFKMYANKHRDVLCKDGNSGEAYISGLGGTREYKVGYRFSSDTNYTWVNFNNPLLLGSGDSCVFKVGGFKKGTYYYKLRDINNCLIKENGFEKVVSINYSEPTNAMRTDVLDVSPITSSTSSNGSISIRLAGGTPQASPAQPYDFEWKDSTTGTPITNFTLVNTTSVFETAISNLDSATYSFKAWDANYLNSLPYNSDGCKTSVNVKMVKPLPLNVAIQLKKQISCVGSNDAQIIAKPTGGVVNSISQYTYKWYKQNSSNGWDLISSTDSVLYNVSVGIYKVEVKDKYNNTKESNYFTVSNPPAITGTTTITASTCYSNADGSASVLPSGGTPPYSFEWSNGVRTQTANNLAGGTYIVYLKDTMGCEAILQAVVTTPVKLLINKNITPVVCNNQCNAAIQLNTSGGTTPYTYSWSNGFTSSSLSSLCSGQYWVRVRDNNNCIYVDTININSPSAFSISAGPDREICLNQKIRLDATVVGQNLTYQWRSSTGQTATTPYMFIQTPGTYMVSGTSATGCTKSDTCYITPVNENIYTDFVVSAQSYTNTNTLMVNLSNPRPVQTEWILPTSTSIQTVNKTRDFCELKFADTGAYNITMKVWYASGCIDEITKKIIVTTKQGFTGLGNQANAFLQNFSIYPNPTTGNFTAQLQFSDITQARLRLINTYTNLTVNDRRVFGSITYNEVYNLYGTLTPGLYILLIETAKGSFIQKIIIQ
jgi:hypothetical protein